MTRECNAIELEGLLDYGEEDAARYHIARCWTCEKLGKTHERIRAAMVAIGDSYQRRPGYQEELRAAIERDQRSMLGRVRGWLGL
jgi:hypothetical protein